MTDFVIWHGRRSLLSTLAWRTRAPAGAPAREAERFFERASSVEAELRSSVVQWEELTLDYALIECDDLEQTGEPLSVTAKDLGTLVDAVAREHPGEPVMPLMLGFGPTAESDPKAAGIWLPDPQARLLGGDIEYDEEPYELAIAPSGQRLELDGATFHHFWVERDASYGSVVGAHVSFSVHEGTTQLRASIGAFFDIFKERGLRGQNNELLSRGNRHGYAEVLQRIQARLGGEVVLQF